MRTLLLLAVVAVSALVGFVVFVRNPQTVPLGEQNIVTKSPGDWRRLDADNFTVYAPATWKFRKMQGIDSDVGEFVGDGARLESDYGQYSNPLSDEKEPSYFVSEEKVSGRLARIVSPKVPGHGVTGIYFRDVGDTNGLNISGRDLSDSQQKMALTIFRTIRFKPALPNPWNQP